MTALSRLRLRSLRRRPERLARRWLSLAAFALALVVSTQASAQEREASAGTAKGETLTLRECIRRALERGFTMEIEQDTFSIAQQEVPIAQSAFHPIISAAVSKSVIRAPATAALPRIASESVDSAVGVSQRLPSGADLGIGIGINHSRFNPAFAALDPAYASDRTITVRQPLLKGFGRGINHLPIARAELSEEIAARTYRSRALDLIESTERAYFAVGGAREQLTVFDKSLELARGLQQEAEAREEAGMSTHLDVLQAQVGVSNAQRNLLQAKSVVEDSEDALLALVGRFEFDTKLDTDRFSDMTDEQSPTSAAPSLMASYDRALSGNPDLLNAKAALDFAQLDFRSARNDLRPSLSLDLALGSNGSNDTTGSAFIDGFEREGTSWQAGLSISVPVGWVAEKARYRQARASIHRQTLAISALEQEILVSVRRAVREVQTQTESVKLTAEAAELSERQYERETQRFNAGLTTSRRVLEAQTDLETAKVTHVQSRLDLRSALASLHRLEASAPERYGIELAHADVRSR